MDKRGLTWVEDWVEILSMAALVIGGVLAVLSPSAVTNYLMILICGFVAGRIIFRRKYKFKFSVVAILLAFIVGYILLNTYGNRGITLLLFLVGSVVSYRLHHDGYVK